MLWGLPLELQLRFETNGETPLQKQSAFTIHRAELQKTGGGPAPKAPSSQLESVIALYQDSASFKGIDSGIETDVLPIGIFFVIF